MLFVTPEQQYYGRTYRYPSENDYSNEFCLLENLQRGYAYKQHQILKRQIQKLNQPGLKFTQDMNNYYVILTKDVNQFNYKMVNRFNNYDLRQIENTLIVKSTNDNFFKQITLPQDVDLTKDITYKLTNNGYRMVICIPKEQSKYQMKTLNFGLPDLIDEIFGDSIAIENKVNEKKRLITGSDEPLPSSIKIPIVYDTKHEEAKVQTHKKPKCTVASNISQGDNEGRKFESEQDIEPLTGLTDNLCNQVQITQKGSEEKMPLQNIPKLMDRPYDNKLELPEVASQNIAELGVVNPLKNYETTKTIFGPNTLVSVNIDDHQKHRNAETDSECQSDTEYIPVRRILSPTLEDVVDQEFM